jgi:hypothetical protein
LRSLSSRIAAFVVTVGLATVGLAACGEESEQSLAFKVGSDGFIQGPSNADPGLTEIVFENASGRKSDMQLIWAKEDHSPAEVSRGLAAAMQGKPLPDWFVAAGGVGLTSNGKSQTVTQVLEPGIYFAVNTEIDGPAEVNDVGRLEVNGDATDDEVDGDATISAFEYGFDAEGLSSGSAEVTFENKGVEPHHIVYAPLKGDTTVDDVKRFLKAEKGKPPFEGSDVRSTAAVEGGDSQLLELDLKPGRYVLLCFISDRQGGPPHALKGMVGEVEVE